MSQNPLRAFLGIPKIDSAFLYGTGLVALFSLFATALAQTAFLKSLGIHTLLLGMVLGMLYANTLRRFAPGAWQSGVDFSARRILRLAVIFYGFHLTFQDIASVGLSGAVISIFMVTVTFLIGYLVGVKGLKLDRELCILCAAGAAICGAAAVLATEGVIKAAPYKTVIALITVVIFGTLAMFLYPALFALGYIPLETSEMGLYIGGSVHEVAHVVGASAAIDPNSSDAAVIVKMVRVMMLVPFLILLGLWFQSGETSKKENKTKKPSLVPWFAVFFIIVAGINSTGFIPENAVHNLIKFDAFLLAMAMCALGMSTDVRTFKQVGMKPFYLGLILFLWLLFGGFFITKITLYLL